jgi:hypothetical protein
MKHLKVYSTDLWHPLNIRNAALLAPHVRFALIQVLLGQREFFSGVPP